MKTCLSLVMLTLAACCLQAQEAEKKEEHRHKNVQSLKELTPEQFMGVMRSFSASLGVGCDFCHVRGQMDSDEKPEKKTARKMLLMTHSINEQFFGGEMEVHCFTCHKGVHHPVSQPPAQEGAGGPPPPPK